MYIYMYTYIVGRGISYAQGLSGSRQEKSSSFFFKAKSFRPLRVLFLCDEYFIIHVSQHFLSARFELEFHRVLIAWLSPHRFRNLYFMTLVITYIILNYLSHASRERRLLFVRWACAKHSRAKKHFAFMNTPLSNICSSLRSTSKCVYIKKVCLLLILT